MLLRLCRAAQWHSHAPAKTRSENRVLIWRLARHCRHLRLEPALTQVNNAGICFHNHTQDLFETSMEDFDKTQAVNFRGVFLGLKHASRCK